MPLTSPRLGSPAGRLLLRPPAQNQTVPNKSAIVAGPFPTPVAAPPPGAEPGPLFTCPGAGRGEGRRGSWASQQGLPLPYPPASPLPVPPTPTPRPRGTRPLFALRGFFLARQPDSGLTPTPRFSSHSHWLEQRRDLQSWENTEVLGDAPRTVPGSLRLSNWQVVLFFQKT